MMYVFSAAIRCGLIEAFSSPIRRPNRWSFSAAIRCGLIEA